VKRAGCQEVSYFRGVWLTDDSTVLAISGGTCSDQWIVPVCGAIQRLAWAGPVNGTYSPTDSDNVTSGEFNVSTWETRDGKPGRLSARHLVPGGVRWEREGRFGGRWINDNQVTAVGRRRPGV